MRKIATLVMTIFLLSMGGYLAWIEYSESEVIRSKMLAMIGFMLSLGGYLLWEDFIRPLFSSNYKTRDDQIL